MKNHAFMATLYLILLTSLLSMGTAAMAQQEVSVTSLDNTPLKAWWFAAPEAQTSSTATMRRPVVIALHGCGGLYANTGTRKGQLNARHQAMGEMLQAQGYHVVFADSLRPRGETSLCAQTIGARKISQRERRADALGTLTWTRQQPWADPSRIAVLGWSHGASAVLAVTDSQHIQVQTSQSAPFKTALAFYPGCSDALKRGYQPNTSLTFFLGADDDWTPPAPCITLAQQLKKEQTKSGHAIELHVYPGAVHDFDTPLPGVRERKDIPSRLHPGKGVMAGQNQAAREDSWARVKDILKVAFQ